MPISKNIFRRGRGAMAGVLAIGCLVGAGAAGEAWRVTAETVGNAEQPAIAESGSGWTKPDKGFRHFHGTKRAVLVEQVAAYLGVSKEEIEKVAQSHPGGWRLVVQAAPYAKVSGKKLADVVAYKASGATWAQTAQHFGVKLEDVQNARKQWMEEQRQKAKDAWVTRLANYLGVPKAEVEQVAQSQEGGGRLVMMAAPIAKLSGKRLADVVAYLANGATIEEAAEHFGVKMDALQNERKQWMKGKGRHGFAHAFPRG